MKTLDQKIPVAILGATGSVGQKFVEVLNDHPWFEVVGLCASPRSAGKKYREACNWFMQKQLPEWAAEMIVKNCDPQEFESSVKPKIVFSGLDAAVAEEIEQNFASAGYIVVSNSKNHRFFPDVPLLIPEVNAEHIELLTNQKWSGGIVTNPNCSTVGLVTALKPLHDAYGLEAVNVTTMQALSGAGYPGVSSLDIIDNLVPFIGGEEEKMAKEPLKLLGTLNDGKVNFADFKVSATCNRVAVIDGHTECVSVTLKKKPQSLEEVKNLWRNFSGLPQELNLPMAPENPIVYFEEDNFPQPKLHRGLDKGMVVSIGRLRECPIFDLKFVLLAHNTVRGAAGGAILNAELLVEKGKV